MFTRDSTALAAQTVEVDDASGVNVAVISVGRVSGVMKSALAQKKACAVVLVCVRCGGAAVIPRTLEMTVASVLS